MRHELAARLVDIIHIARAGLRPRFSPTPMSPGRLAKHRSHKEAGRRVVLAHLGPVLTRHGVNKPIRHCRRQPPSLS